jgi:hypothetical protein
LLVLLFISYSKTPWKDRKKKCMHQKYGELVYVRVGRYNAIFAY